MSPKDLLEAMADLEARIAKIYERFATEFRDVADVGDLWASMGREELHHAEHLSLAAGRAPAEVVPAELVDHLHRLEALVAEREREVAHVVLLQDALRVTVDLEEGEARNLHDALSAGAGWARQLAENPTMQHRQRHVLEHAVQLFGTPAIQQRLAPLRFQD